MSSIPYSAAPPLFFHLVSEISKKGVSDNQFLVDSILQVEKISSSIPVITSLLTSNETNEVGKRDLFLLLINILATHQNLDEDDGINDDFIISVCSTIASFPIIVKEHQTYETLAVALGRLFKKLTDPGMRNLQTNVRIADSPYISFVFAVLSIESAIRLTAILVTPINIPLYEGLKLFFENHKYDDLDENDKAAINRYNTTQVVGSQVTAFSDNTKEYGLSLLLAFFHFWPEEAQKICPTLDTTLGFSKKGNLKISAVSLLEKIDIGTNAQKVAQTLCSTITEYNEYAKSVVNYTTQKIDNIDEIVPILLKSDTTALGGCYIAQRRDLFASKPETVNVAFPNPIKRMNIAIELAMTIEKPCEQLYEAMLNQALVTYASSNGVIKGLDKFVELSKGHPECFANLLLKRLCEVTNIAVLEKLANIIEEVGIKPVEPSDADLYYKLICHLYSTLSNSKTSLEILKIYRDISETDVTIPAEFLKNCIKSTENAAFLTVAETLINQYPKSAVLYVSIPSSADEKIDGVIKAVQKDDIFNFELGVSFFTTLSTNYLERFFVFLENAKAGSQVTNNIFVNRKIRVRASETVKSVLKVLPTVLAEKNFDADGQKRLYAILTSIIPRVNINEFTAEIEGIRPLFALLGDATPSEAEYNTFIDCGYMREFPLIFKNVEPNEELSHRLITLYVSALEKYEVDEENIGSVCDVLLTLDPTEETIFFALELVKKNILPKDNLLKYAIFVQKFGEAAKKKGIKVTLPKFAGFLLRYMIHLTSLNVEYRLTSFAAFENLFGVEPTCKDIDAALTQEQISERVLNLFKAVQAEMSIELVNAITQLIILKKAYFSGSSIFLRSLFEFRESFASADYSKNILKLFLAQPGMPAVCRFHLDKGVYALAERSLIEFIAIFLLSESPYQGQIVQVILMNPKLRRLFIDTTFTYLNKSEHVERSLNLFYIIKRIILTEETNDVSTKSFGMLFSSIVLWLGAIHDQRKSLNLIQQFNATSEISTIVDMITTRTCLANRYELSISVSDIPHIASSLRLITNILSTVPIANLETLNEYILKILDSPNQSYRLTAGLFIVEMIQSYTGLSSISENYVKEALPEAYVAAFENGSPNTVCCLCFASDVSIIAKLSDEQCKKVAKRIVAAIASDDEKIFVPEATLYLSNFIEKLSGAELDAEQLLAGLRNTFAVASVRQEYLKVIIALLDVKCSYEDFAPPNAEKVEEKVLENNTNNNVEKKDDDNNEEEEEEAEKEKKPTETVKKNENGCVNLNVKKIFGWIPAFQDDTLAILRKISGTADIASGLKGKLEDNVIAGLGLDLIKSAKSCNADLLALFVAIQKVVAGCDDEGAVMFRKALLLKAIIVGEEKQSQVKEAAAEIIKSFVI